MATDTTDIAVREETAITRADPEQLAGALQHILATGDLSKLTNEQRVSTYLQQCSTLGLNPISRPFDWLLLDGKLVLYPNKSCAEQLRRIHQISVKVTRFEVIGGDSKEPMVVVTVEGHRPNGQTDESTKYVSLMGWNNRTQQAYRLSGRELASAYAKAETGAKRRLALSMIGLAAPPDDMENARQVIVDGTGRIIDNPTDMDRAAYDDPRLARAIGQPTYEDLDSESSPLTTTVSQAPTAEELAPPTRPYQSPARFHCDVEKWRSTWFAVVRDTHLDADDDRHDFIRWYTSNWPENRRTDSLGTFLKRATDRQAEALINAAREHLAEEDQARADDPDGELDGIDGVTSDEAAQIAIEQRGQANYPVADERVHQAAVLTGAPPSKPVATQADGYARPDPDGAYTRRELVNQYLAVVKRRKALDRGFRPGDIDRLSDADLRAARIQVDDETNAIEEAIAVAAEHDDDDGQADDSAPLPF